MSKSEFTEREATTLESTGRRGPGDEVSGRVDPDRLRELEQAVARCEAQIRGLQERLLDTEGRQRAGKQRALWTRLMLLVLLLTGWMLLRKFGT